MAVKPVMVAVDTGGTFTDFICYAQTGEIMAFKTASTPRSPDRAIREGFRSRGLPFSARLLHGTTVATNALLERKLPPVALVVTRGFRDIVAIGRQNRKKLYDLTPEVRTPLLKERMILEADERVLADGCIARRISRRELVRLRGRLARLGARSVAVCFLHAYKNPENERAVREFLNAAGISFVSISSEVVCEYREYERFSTTLINAVLLTVIEKYLAALEGAFLPDRIHIMQSNGGIISNAEARRLPVKTILSGPAGGVVASFALGRLIQSPKMISFDMGGTSTDVSLIDREIHYSSQAEIADFPVKVSVIDIHTVGAGGGSIARFDAGGVLRVGPESVGADPGPAFYGAGDHLSVSDANLLSRRLLPDLLAVPRVEEARSRQLAAAMARRHGLKLEELLAGILRVVNSNMERAIKKISIERGYDLREFALLSFGGAGGLHAAYMARDLGMKGVIFPRYAGVFSALGILSSDVMADVSRTVLWREPAAEKLAAGFAAMLHEQKGNFLKANRLHSTAALMSLDVRYVGQSYEINVPTGRNWRRRFHYLHNRLYGSSHRERSLEVVNLRLMLVGKGGGLRLPAYPRARAVARPARRETIFWEEGPRLSAVYFGEELRPGHAFSGPAVILNPTATAIVPPGFRARVDPYLDILIRP